MHRSIDIVQFDKLAKPVAFEALPTSFQEAYAKSLEQTRTAYKNLKPGDLGGTGQKIKP